MTPALTRRALGRQATMLGLTAWLAGSLGGGLAGGLTGCTAPAGLGTAVPADAITPLRLADGVYMVPGARGEADAGNQGRIGNSGFIVGPSGVIAVDAGTSYAHGLALLAAIRSVTAQPVKLLLITQIHQEFLFGASAFAQQGASVQMHRKSELLMKARCETCLKTLTQLLGETTLRGTRLVKPDRVFDGSHELDLIGRPVRVHYFGHSSGPGDIAVEDVETHSLFAGGLLDNQRIPDVQDSSLPGWHSALQALAALAPRHLIPGHGPAGDAALIGQVDAYLQVLEQRGAELVKAGTPLSEVPDAMAQPAFAAWDQYDPIHRRNASIVFLRLERDFLLRP